MQGLFPELSYKIVFLVWLNLLADGKGVNQGRSWSKQSSKLPSWHHQQPGWQFWGTWAAHSPRVLPAHQLLPQGLDTMVVRHNHVAPHLCHKAQPHAATPLELHTHQGRSEAPGRQIPWLCQILAPPEGQARWGGSFFTLGDTEPTHTPLGV